jgi:hypothetical protein
LVARPNRFLPYESTAWPVALTRALKRDPRRPFSPDAVVAQIFGMFARLNRALEIMAGSRRTAGGLHTFQPNEVYIRPLPSSRGKWQISTGGASSRCGGAMGRSFSTHLIGPGPDHGLWLSRKKKAEQGVEYAEFGAGGHRSHHGVFWSASSPGLGLLFQSTLVGEANPDSPRKDHQSGYTLAPPF